MKEKTVIKYGYLKTDISDIGDIRKYHDLFNDPSRSLSEAECGDLNLDDFFEFSDRCVTPVGEMLLFSKLRHRGRDKMFRVREQMAERLGSGGSFRKDVESALSGLAGNKGSSTRHLLDMKVSLSRYHGFLFVLPVVETAFIIILCILTPPAAGIIAGVILAIVNTAIHYRNKTYVESYLRPLVQLGKIREAAVRLSSLDPESGFGDIRTPAAEVSVLSRKIGIFGMNAVMESDIMMVFNTFLELLKTILLIEPIYTYLILKDIDDISANARTLMEYIGEWDISYSTASLRSWMESEGMKWSKPVFTGSKGYFKGEGLRHPLISDCVANDIKIDKPVIITGSNMSGKSSFLKTIGINIIASDAIGTCFADSLELPDCRIHTMLSASDDIKEGKSYYYAEAGRIKEILDRCIDHKEGVTETVLIDEIFKGTNTVERIAIADAVIRYLSKLPGTYAVVSTHDIELARSFKGVLDTYHFSEDIHEGILRFNYKLTPGVEYTRNAISILRIIGYPAEITEAAEANTLNSSLS